MPELENMQLEKWVIIPSNVRTKSPYLDRSFETRSELDEEKNEQFADVDAESYWCGTYLYSSICMFV